MNGKWTVVHIEDEGEPRVDFLNEVLPPDEFPFEVVHLNPVEELISFRETVKRAAERKDADFFVIDLALSPKEHNELDRWFSEESFPLELPENFESGIGVAYQLVTKYEVDPSRIAFLTRHRSTSLFRDLNRITRFWLGFSIQAFYKQSYDLKQLRALIFSVCNFSPSKPNQVEMNERECKIPLPEDKFKEKYAAEKVIFVSINHSDDEENDPEDVQQIKHCLDNVEKRYSVRFCWARECLLLDDLLANTEFLIEQCDALIAFFTASNQVTGRERHNPNVVFEVGYAKAMDKPLWLCYSKHNVNEHSQTEFKDDRPFILLRNRLQSQYERAWKIDKSIIRFLEDKLHCYPYPRPNLQL